MKNKKVLIITLTTIIVFIGLFLFLSRKTIIFFDPIDNNSYTTKALWIWESDEYYLPTVTHGKTDGVEKDCIASGMKKIRQGYGIFSDTEYEITFTVPEFKITYEIDDYIETVDGVYSVNDPSELKFDFNTENKIIGWYNKNCYENNPDDCEIYTFLPAGWSSDITLIPVYDGIVN